MKKRTKKAAVPKADFSLLDNWNTLNSKLMELGEGQVEALLEEEKRDRNRLTFTLRLHSRLNKLRRDRERSELAKGSA